MKIIKRINLSASYAIQGVCATFKEEFMARVQFSFGLIQFLIALLVGAPLNEIVIIILVWVILVSQECMNTGIENLTDLVVKDKQDPLAKRAKDSAAGAVVLISITSWIIFVLLIGNDIINFIK